MLPSPLNSSGTMPTIFAAEQPIVSAAEHRSHSFPLTLNSNHNCQGAGASFSVLHRCDKAPTQVNPKTQICATCTKATRSSQMYSDRLDDVGPITATSTDVCPVLQRYREVA